MGSRAFLARSGVMIIENGQVTIVASGSIASLSLATIENPEERPRREYINLFLSLPRGRAGARASCQVAPA
jgi:hypothetical protein